jgi:HD-like signal output (HDOD) protein
MSVGTRPASRLQITPEDIIRSVRHLPSAPKVLPQLKLLLQDGNSELSDVVTLVRIDPGLALRVLQIANSPYFFTGARCLTVEDAIARVGYDEVYWLVAYAVSVQVLNRPVVVYHLEADQMWAHSVCCALAAESLAERVGVDPAAAYTLGLLHGVGMIAIDEWALRTGQVVRMAVNPFPLEATRSERALFGFTQADVGAALLESWEFPAEIVDPVRFQYSPGTATNWGALASLLVAARWIRSAVLSPVAGALPPLPSPAQVRPAGISVAALTDAVPFVTTELAAVSTMLEQAEEPRIDRHAFPARGFDLHAANSYPPGRIAAAS